MAIMGDTGHGATLGFSTTSITFVVRRLTLPEWGIEDVDATDLSAADFMQMLPGDLSDPGEIQAEVIFDTSEDAPSFGTVETGTVTFPTRSGETTAANLAGTGWIKGFTFPVLETETLQTATLTFKFDGDTGPAFTKSAAV